MNRLSISAIFIAALLTLVLFSGCGKQTEDANRLVDEASAINSDTQQKVAQTETLILQAGEQQTQGQTDAQKATLGKVKALNDEVLSRIAEARAKTDQAAALNISDSYRRQLQASSTALGAAQDLFRTQQEMVVLLISDPVLEGQDSKRKYAELQTRATDQRTILEDADAEAKRLAEENASLSNK
ncbi:MAG: hypothetical protein WC828_04720 [Thermoleophilia bacterium]